ncbi:MAG: DUF1127 domain-containing protein [Rhodospirillales bacterium]|nr:DUF1127 domain-containing protein [Rhodospirillales bacterium]
MHSIENNSLNQAVQANHINAAVKNLFRAVVQLPEKTIGQLYTWQARQHYRSQLRNLSEAQLRDVGLSRAMTDAEADNPFLIP